MNDAPGSPPDFSGSGAVPYDPGAFAAGPTSAPAAAGYERLLALPGVVSVGLGHGPAGEAAVTVGVADAADAARLPRRLDGLPVVVMVTGPVDALPQR